MVQARSSDEVLPASHGHGHSHGPGDGNLLVLGLGFKFMAAAAVGLGAAVGNLNHHRFPGGKSPLPRESVAQVLPFKLAVPVYLQLSYGPASHWHGARLTCSGKTARPEAAAAVRVPGRRAQSQSPGRLSS